MANPRPIDPNGPLNDLILARMKAISISSLAEFADHAGIGRATLYNLVQGRVSANGTSVKPGLDTLVRLAEALNVPAHELLYRLEPDARGMDFASPILNDVVAIDRVGYVGAGPGENEECQSEQVWVSKRFAAGKNLLAYTVRGNSMAGGKRPIHDGDTIIVNTLDKGSSGDAIVARLYDQVYVCKALKQDKFGKRLMSTNTFYTNSTPPVIPASDVEEIIGKVVRLWGNVDSLED